MSWVSHEVGDGIQGFISSKQALYQLVYLTALFPTSLMGEEAEVQRGLVPSSEMLKG